MNAKDAVATVETISAQKTKKALSITIALLMDTGSAMSNALNIGADNGRKTTNGMKKGKTMRLIDADALKNQIKKVKRCFTSENSDYMTGYISALSVVEGMIAYNEADPVTTGPCGFCARFDFGGVKAQIDKYGARVVTAVCCTEYPLDEQFNFCPVCGRFLKNERNEPCSK